MEESVLFVWSVGKNAWHVLGSQALHLKEGHRGEDEK